MHDVGRAILKPTIRVSTSIIARDSNRVARTSCAFQAFRPNFVQKRSLFFCGLAFRPHVYGKNSDRKRNFQNLRWLACKFDLEQSVRRSSQVHASRGQTETQVLKFRLRTSPHDHGMKNRGL